jgi:hypothetical protein
LKTVPEILQERYENKLKGSADTNGEAEDRDLQPPPAKKQKLDHSKKQIEKPIKKQEKKVAEPEDSDDSEEDHDDDGDANGEEDDAMDVQEIDEDSDSDSDDNSKNRIRNVESEKHSELKKKLLEKINEMRKQRSVPLLGGNFNVLFFFFGSPFILFLKFNKNRLGVHHIQIVL